MTDTDRAAWLEQRRKGLGGSDISAVAGVHPYRSAWSVYWDKVGDVRDDNAGEAASWGQALEDLIACRWHAQQGPADTALADVGHLRHPDIDWYCGTPDYTLMQRSTHGWARTAGVEVKNVGYLAWQHHWSGGGVIPPWIELQCNWYAELLDVDTVHLAVLVNGSRLADPLTVDRNPDRIKKLVAIGERFWHDHVLAGIPPNPDGSARAREELDIMYPPSDHLAATQLPHGAEDVAVNYLKWREVEQRAGREKDALGQLLIATLGEAQATDGYIAGREEPIVTYRPSRMVDLDAVRRDHPDVLERCLRDQPYSVDKLRHALGVKALAEYQRPEGSRRLHVRDTANGDD